MKNRDIIKFNAKEVLMGDMFLLDNTSLGAVFRLIINSWVREDGCLIRDDEQLKIMSGMTDNEWNNSKDKILSCFTLDNGVIYYDSLRDELNRAKALHENNSRGGRIGSKTRWGDRKQPKMEINKPLSQQIYDIYPDNCPISGRSTNKSNDDIAVIDIMLRKQPFTLMKSLMIKYLSKMEQAKSAIPYLEGYLNLAQRMVEGE